MFITKPQISYSCIFIYPRYDGTLKSLEDKSRKPHYHPKQHTQEEIDLIKRYKANNKKSGLVVLWVKLRKAGYTRTV